MLDSTQQKGLKTELLCLQDCINLGFQCSIPFGDSSKYDILVDVGSRILRVQCKSSRWAKNTVQPEVAFDINTCRQTTNTQKTTRHKYSNEEIDYFYTNFNQQGYLVSIEEANGVSFRWRYTYPSTGQKSGIHLASEYEIEEVLKKLVV